LNDGRSSHSSGRVPNSQSLSGSHRLGGKYASGGGYASSRAPGQGTKHGSGGKQSSNSMHGSRADRLGDKHGRGGMHALNRKQAPTTPYTTRQKHDGRMKQNAGGTHGNSNGCHISASNGYREGVRCGSGNDSSRPGDDGSCYGGRDIRHTGTTRGGQDDLGLDGMNLRGGSPSHRPSSRETLYEHFLTVYGRKLDPNNRSHWAFMICCRSENFGNRYHLTLISREAFIYT
jgi:hypothetical protein